MLRKIALFVLFGLRVALAADVSSIIGDELRKPILHPHQTTIESQVYAASLVKAMPSPHSATEWNQQAARLRSELLANVVFRGEAAAWRQAPTRVEWVETLECKGYRIRKFRYEVVPGMWVPALLYEPAQLNGKVPAVINLNGHEGGGMSIPYIQERCINLARKGMLAYNYEWFWKGQMTMDGYSHNRMNQLDLLGTSGIAPFFLAQTRLVDIALENPHTDPARVAATGLSGGGWQTIFLSSLDPRIKLAVPAAGYSSFVTRAQWPDMDLGDSEQAPSDLGSVTDYTVLTAMLAPRPALIIGNARDTCCFRADYAISPLIVAARPFYALYSKPDALRYHINYDEGHNYSQDSREALYAFLGEHFFAGDKRYSAAEIPSRADVKSVAELRVALPERNEDFHTLAVKLCDRLPSRAKLSADAGRSRLASVVRWPEYRVVAQPAGTEVMGGLQVSRFRLAMGNAWTVPVAVFDPGDAAGTTMIFGDTGRASLVNEVTRLMDEKRRVIATDAYYFGESAIGKHDYSYPLQIASLGQRTLGIQAAEVAAVARWAKAQFGPVTLAAVGPRSGVIALIAAAVDTDGIAGVQLTRPFKSLREVIERNLDVINAPELFCFGLLAGFDLSDMERLVAPRPVAKPD